MKLFIKNMVSIRCKMIVQSELERIGLVYTNLELGEVSVMEDISDEQFIYLKAGLLKSGLELIEDKKGIIIEKIKNIIVEMVHYSNEMPKVKFSHFISSKLNYNYTYLSGLFSEVKGMTIEHFIILHKIERVKELLTYGEMSLTEIARAMHYSSTAHLANQFKKITGLTASHFKNIQVKRAKGLEDL